MIDVCLRPVVVHVAQRVDTSLVVIVTPHICDSREHESSKRVPSPMQQLHLSCVLWIVARTTLRSQLLHRGIPRQYITANVEELLARLVYLENEAVQA